jgi:hypothetical protein
MWVSPPLEKAARYGHRCKREDHPSGVAHQPSPHRDGLNLHAPQRPVLHRCGHGQSAQEVAQGVGQHEQGEAHLVGNARVTGTPGPVQGILAVFSPGRCCASASVEADYPSGWIAQVGHDDTPAGQPLPPVPLPLGYPAARTVPAPGLVGERMGVHDKSGRLLPWRSLQHVGDIALQHPIAGQPDGVAHTTGL